MSITPTRAAAWTVAIFAALLLPVLGAASSGMPSAERRGRFICTNSACLSVWHPLVVAKGVKPTGRIPLGTIRRPDGRMQVTYKGAPLYTFVRDTKPGEMNGEGFKDVGVWQVTTVGAAAAAPKPKSSPGYGY